MVPTSVEQLAALLASHDRSSFEHSQRVCRLSLALATHLGLPVAERQAAALAGFLHDMGKLAISPAILTKPTPLSRSESEVMSTHAAIGCALVEPLVTVEVGLAVAHHHDRFDSLRTGEVPWLARLVSVADTYDALVSARPYRPGGTRKAAFSELRRVAGTQLDPALVEALIAVEAGATGLRFAA